MCYASPFEVIYIYPTCFRNGNQTKKRIFSLLSFEKEKNLTIVNFLLNTTAWYCIQA